MPFRTLPPTLALRLTHSLTARQRGSTHCTARHRSRSPLSGISLHMIATCTLDFHPAILAFCRHDAPFRAEPIHHIKSQPLARASDGRLMLASFGRRPSSRRAQVDWHFVLSLVGFFAHSFYGAPRVTTSLWRGCRRLLLGDGLPGLIGCIGLVGWTGFIGWTSLIDCFSDIGRFSVIGRSRCST